MNYFTTMRRMKMMLAKLILFVCTSTCPDGGHISVTAIEFGSLHQCTVAKKELLDRDTAYVDNYSIQEAHCVLSDHGERQQSKADAAFEYIPRLDDVPVLSEEE